MGKLTAARVGSITTPGKYYDQHGLILRVAPGGSKQWVWRGTIRGRRRDIGLGSVEYTSLAEARDIAYEYRRIARAGGDLAALRALSTAPTFAEMAERVIETRRGGWKEGGKSEENWRASLQRYVHPQIGAMPVDEITTADLMRVLLPIWHSKRGTARKVKTRMGIVMRYALAEGHRVEDIAGPALTAALPRYNGAPAKHFASLPYHEVAAAFARLDSSPQMWRPTVACLWFIAATVVRSGEARLATWEEIDLETLTWTVPGRRTKTGREHVVPLSPTAVAALDESRSYGRRSRLVFPSPMGRTLTNGALSRFTREEGFTPHGLRASFRTWCAETGVSREIAEAALAHSAGQVERAYQRSDLLAARREVMDAWSRVLSPSNLARNRVPRRPRTAILWDRSRARTHFASQADSPRLDQRAPTLCSGWAVLAAGALVASLLAVGAAPAAAAEIKAGTDNEATPDEEASRSACVGPATESAGFTDTAGLGAEAAIDCLAYYEITVGKTATTFDPGSDVTRTQMALFLSRAAKLMGVDLMGGDMMADFGDIDDQDEERQAAITALARNGILEGRSDMAFEPSGLITRAEMAVALVSLLDKTPEAPVHKNSDGLFTLGTSQELPNDWFADARASTPRHVDNAISAAYELGVTTGAGDGSTFRPHDTVPRKNMASFITRALHHSNVRPAGLTAQATGGDITVSVRDASFAPVVNQAIDAFYISADDEARAFKDDGTCQAGRVTMVDGSDKCEIDEADPVTQTDGNITLSQIDSGDIGDGLTAWVWDGDVGDKFDATTDSYELSVAKGPVTVDASSAVISTDLAKGATRAHFGSAVTVTIQLKGTSGSETVDAGPGDDNVVYSVYTQYYTGSTATGTPFNSATSTVKVGSDGSASFPVVASDPSAQASNMVTVRYTVSRSVVLETDVVPSTLLVPNQGDSDTGTISDGTTQGTTPETYRFTDTYTSEGGNDIVFSDEKAKVETVTVEAPNRVAPGTVAAGTAATVTVLDQFGKPFRGAGIVLTSDNTADAAAPQSTPPTKARLTGSNGQVRIGYSYTGAASVETLTAIWDGDMPDADDEENDGTGEGQADDTACRDIQDDGLNSGGNDICGTDTVYWIGQIRDDNSGTTADPVLPTGFVDFTGATHVRDHDPASRQIVVAADAATAPPHAIHYDSGDHFAVITVGTVPTPSTMADFEAALTKRLAAVAKGTEVPPQLSWTNYDYDDSVKITAFTLDLTPAS